MKIGGIIRNVFFQKYKVKSEFSIDGFARLRYEDQEELRRFMENKRKRKHDDDSTGDESDGCSEPPTKLMKQDPETSGLEALIKKQNKEFHELRSQIEKNLDKFWQRQILEDNDQEIPSNACELLDHVTDIIYFGAIERCQQNGCKNGRFVFDGNSTYRCAGYISECGRCCNTVTEPPRRPVQVRDEIQNDENCAFLNVEFKVQHRALKTPVPFKGIDNRSLYRAETSNYHFFGQFDSTTVKDGTTVDSQSHMGHNTHVYVANGLTYSAVLVKIDFSEDKNSQYRMQLLESDDENPRTYWVFRSWGRIGTILGKTCTHEYDDLKEAVKEFHKIYKEKTDNEFTATNFIKYHGKYHRLTTSGETVRKADLTQSSNLPKPVEDLLKLLVDEDLMNDFMIVFRMNTRKMPLAKIGQMEIRQATIVLKEIKAKLFQRESHERLVEASNRFYSLIPQSVTADDVIDSKEKLKEKAELLKSIRDLQFTYKLLHKDTGERAGNILDDFYNDLNVKIEPLEKDSYEYHVIATYANETQMNCDLEIEEIFKISRNEGDLLYEPYENLPNKTLLWHGSRIINIASILSQGLKIAPPEASAIGCSFGKGLYFADVFEKSAGYCFAHQSNNIGLVLLCEVALGNSLKCYYEENIETLPDGKHSVHGVGKFSSQSNISFDGAIVPHGKPVEDENVESILNFNEFVIYNESQVKIKYLIRVKFNRPVFTT